MARLTRDSRLETRKGRERLSASKKPYWHTLEHGRSIGYRKTATGGAWIARMYLGDKKHEERRLGAADDTLDADGVHVLSWQQAQGAARDWFEARAHELAGRGRADLTVKEAADDYMAWFRTQRKSVQQFQKTIDAHILPDLGKLVVRELTSRQIRTWLNKVASSGRRLRTRKGEAQKFAPPPQTKDEIRARRSTANGVLTTLKALLNHAARENEAISTAAWDRIEPFEGVDAARIRFLEPDEARRLVNACDPDFRPMIIAGLHTGARYSELCRLRVGDYQQGRLFFGDTKDGKSRWISLTAEGRAFFDAQVAGRHKTTPMLPRPDGDPWGPNHQSRRVEAACVNGRIEPRCTFHELRHTYASLSLMNGMPMLVLAQNLGHTDTRMVEKHYGHLLQSYKDEMVENHAPKFGFDGQVSTIVKIAIK
jgi:integrase